MVFVFVFMSVFVFMFVFEFVFVLSLMKRLNVSDSKIHSDPKCLKLHIEMNGDVD